IDALSALLVPHYNNVVAGHLDGLDRIKMDCAVGGDVGAVRELIEWESRNPRELLTAGSNGIRYDIPESLLGRIDPATASSPVLTVETMLTALTVAGSKVVVAAEAKVRGLLGRAPGIAIRCRGRETGV